MLISRPLRKRVGPSASLVVVRCAFAPWDATQLLRVPDASRLPRSRFAWRLGPLRYAPGTTLQAFAYACSYSAGSGSSPLLPRPCSPCGSLRTFRKAYPLRSWLYFTLCQSRSALLLAGRLVATRRGLATAVQLRAPAGCNSGSLGRSAFLGFLSFAALPPRPIVTVSPLEF